MIIPFIASVMRDVFSIVPPMLKEGAYGLGATTWEVVRQVIVPHTRIGLVGSVMLGLGRALGETMAITFIIGNAFQLPNSLFSPSTSIASAIANEFNEAGGLQKSALMELGLLLFVITTMVLILSRLMITKMQQTKGNKMKTNQNLRFYWRKTHNKLMLGLSYISVIIGLFWLCWILFTLITKGIPALSIDLFTQSTPAPNEKGDC